MCQYCREAPIYGVYSATLKDTKLCQACYKYERKHKELIPRKKRFRGMTAKVNYYKYCIKYGILIF